MSEIGGLIVIIYLHRPQLSNTNPDMERFALLENYTYWLLTDITDNWGIRTFVG